MAHRLSTRLLRAAVLGLLGAALAWATPGLASTGTQSSITVTAKCVGTAGKLRIDYTVRSWEPELTAPEVEVWFSVNGGAREPLPSGSFAPGQEEFSGHFLIDAPAAEGSTLVIFARAHWTDQSEKSINQKSAPLPLPVCPAAATSTTAPPTTVAATTTTAAVAGASSTTAAAALPFTGSGSMPTLLAGLGLLAGGALILWVGRARGRHARS